MTDQQTNNSGGTPGGSPGGNAGGDSGSRSFIAARSAQMAETMQRALDAEHEPAPDAGRQQQPQLQTPHSPPAEQKIRIGDAEYDAADVQSAIAERAEGQVRKSGLPQSPDQYEVKNSAAFQLPEGVSKFEFNMADPTLAAAKKFAMANNLTQEQFSGMLDLFVASKSGELLNQVRAREANLQQLGAAGPQRVQAIATWLSARAGKDGAAVGNFIREYPSAPIVRAVETLIKQFSNQGGSDYSQSHRDQGEDQGKIPGYENMSFVQKRAAQMAQMLNRPGRGGGRRGE
jgi:hypothetical protein